MSSFGQTVTDSVTEPTDESPMLDARTHPVINTPSEEPQRHWKLDARGRAPEGWSPVSPTALLDSDRVASGHAPI